MYVAAKYEEMYPPALEEFSFITDNTYETKHILRMEQIVMKVSHTDRYQESFLKTKSNAFSQMLNFSLSGPTSYTFLQHYLVNIKSVEHADHHQLLALLSNYLCVLSLLQDRPFSSFSSSLVAASCLFVANRLLKSDATWSSRYVQLTSYREEDLRPCATALNTLYSKTYQQDETTSSLLRRFMKSNKDNELFQRQIKHIIHRSSNDEDEILDLTLDELDDEMMNFT